ncbi:hypothetical protein ACFPN0_16445 [Kitasatospora cinereorecta]
MFFTVTTAAAGGSRWTAGAHGHRPEIVVGSPPDSERRGRLVTVLRLLRAAGEQGREVLGQAPAQRRRPGPGVPAGSSTAAPAATAHRVPAAFADFTPMTASPSGPTTIMGTARPWRGRAVPISVPKSVEEDD